MKYHRGLGAVVGTVFLVAVVISALSYVSYSLNVMGNLSESLMVEESRQKDKQDESFAITSIDITTSNKLDGIIKNTGEIPVKVKTLYIDEQGVNDVVQKYILDAAISPGNTINIIDLVDFDIDPNKGYNMKVISSRGEVNSFYINSASQQSLPMYIKAVPEFVPSEFTTTIIYSIVNNMSNNNVLYNVTPELTISDLVGSDIAALRSGPNPTSYPVLSPGDVAIFEYSVQLSGNADDSVLFNATVVNGMSDNWATTQATIKEVTIATQAGTALESFGLSTALSNDLDILYLHDENSLTPNNEYQMDGSEPAGPGTTFSLRSGNITHITASVSEDTDIINGVWNMTMSYWSDLTPNGVPTPDMAWHFTCDNCGGNGQTSESTGNINNDDLEKQGLVTHFTSGGPDDDGYYHLGSSEDYLQAEWNAGTEYTDHQEIGGEPATTAVWFRIPSTSDNYFPIVRWGDANDGDDEYEIALGDGGSGSHGNLVYRYDTDQGNGDETKCETDGSYDYDDGQWHFVVAARSGDDDCKLYVDGSLADDVEECNNCEDTSSMDVSGTNDIYVGYDGAGNECENCDFASWMHWDNQELDAGDIQELYYTNYGNNGTRMIWTLERTDAEGVVQETIYSGTQYLPFADPAANSDSSNRYDSFTGNDVFEKYSFYNATLTTIANVTLTSGDRLKSTLSWDDDSQNLDMNIRVDDDDSGYVFPTSPTYIQTPPVFPALPTFITITNDENPLYIIFNGGPNGAWFTYSGTRFVVTLPDGSESYGGLVVGVNGSQVNEDQDSIFIPDQYSAEIEFYPLANPPQTQPSAPEKAPPGIYNAAVFLSGFDDKGETFLRTINVGTVNVVD